VVRAIFSRDFLGYFSSPAGYVFTALFVAIAAFATVGLPEFFANNLASLDTLNHWMPYLLLFFIPAITMSIWAEERKQGTEELLLTLPARDVEVVLGKYLSALGIYTVSLVFLALGLLVIFLVIPGLGRPDLGVFFATFLGHWLMGAMLIAFGMVASSLSPSVTVAFILGGLLCALPVFAELIGSMLTGLGAPGRSLGRMVQALSIPEQFRDFGSGVIRLSSVLYFVAGAAAMLYLNMVLLGRRHWAGGERSRGLWLHYLTRFVALVVALASLNVLVNHTGVRADVSAERINTLSAESRRLIREVPRGRPVFIEAFYSPEVPREYVQVKRDMLNLLREIQSIGGDRVRLNLVEAPRFSAEARDAESRFGITPRRVVTLNEARQSTEEILLGVAFSSGADRVVVPFLDRGLPVEYELIRSLRVVSGSKRKKVGILQTDARLLGGFDFAMRSQASEWEIVTELKKQYDVTSVAPDQPIPTDLDALLVAQPSSLTPPQAENLTTYVKAGGPALLFVDPIVIDDPTLAPSEPRMPAGGMFGGSPPPEPKADLASLMDALDVNWPIDQIVWNPYNPHPSLDYLDPEILFIGNGSKAPGGAFGADPVSGGLQEVVLLFSGLLKPRGTRLDVDFVPLMRTNEEGGTLAYREILTAGLMGIPQLNPRRPYFATGQPYVTAARIRGKAPATAATKEAAKPGTPPPAAKSLNVILIADLDMISDRFFAMRRKPTESMDSLTFDNVTFILNCVDSLAGDDSFLALRKRRPVHRTLEAIERETRRFVEASQDAGRKADDAAKRQLAEAQKRLDDKVKAVEKREDMDPRTKDILLSQQQSLENRRLEVEKANIEAEADHIKETAAAVEQQGIRGIHSRAKVLAVLIPPLPVLLLGLAVFLVRHGRENRGASPNRLA
jgi:ABC-2 type transport system permease protein